MAVAVLFGGVSLAWAVVILRWRYLWDRQARSAWPREYFLTEFLFGVTVSTMFSLLLLVGSPMPDVYLVVLASICWPLTACVAWRTWRAG